MPRFVLLEHTGSATYKPGRHCDLMLEADGQLRTWELENTPSPGIRIRAFALPNHRLTYLDYEGPVDSDRGTVAPWDAGTYEVVSESAGNIVVRLAGRQLRGQLSLISDLAEPSAWWAEFGPALH